MIAFNSSMSAECRKIVAVLVLSRCSPKGSVEGAIAVDAEVALR